MIHIRAKVEARSSAQEGFVRDGHPAETEISERTYDHLWVFFTVHLIWEITAHVGHRRCFSSISYDQRVAVVAHGFLCVKA